MGFGGSKTVAEAKAYVSLDLRVVDTTTGEVVGCKTVEDRAKIQPKKKDLVALWLPWRAWLAGLQVLVALVLTAWPQLER